MVAALWCKATGCQAEECFTNELRLDGLDTYWVGIRCMCTLHGHLPLQPAVSRTLLQHGCCDNIELSARPYDVMMKSQPCTVSGGLPVLARALPVSAAHSIWQPA